MKKFIFGILLSGFWGQALFAAWPAVQDRGPVSYATMTAINLQKIPILLLSTGTNMAEDSARPSANIATGTVVQGQYMSNRISLDIVNYSTINIFLGYDKNVSSVLGDENYGWMIPGSTAGVSGGNYPNSLRLPGSIQNLWIVAEATIPSRQVLVIQQK